MRPKRSSMVPHTQLCLSWLVSESLVCLCVSVCILHSFYLLLLFYFGVFFLCLFFLGLLLLNLILFLVFGSGDFRVCLCTQNSQSIHNGTKDCIDEIAYEAVVFKKLISKRYMVWTGLEPNAVSQLIHIYFFIISFECWLKGKHERIREKERESEREIY